MAIDHLTAIKSGKVSVSNIIGIRKLLNANWRYNQGYSIGRTSPALATDNEYIDMIWDATHKHAPYADKALHTSGRARLTDRRYTSRWTQEQQTAIDNLAAFRLVDWYEWQRGQFIPVWMVVSTSGDEFKFINPSWQSGGNGPQPI